MSEFNLIAKYFTRNAVNADLGVGDDAALIRINQGQQLAVSTDMSVANTHFYANTAPFEIGWKCMAVNISDMAAMGAIPKWATLAIALPEVDEPWLAEFSRGLFACADQFEVSLIGGDTTHGALNISIQIMGEVPIGRALLRSSAQTGDDVWVSGCLGSAAMGLLYLQNKIQLPDNVASACLNNLHHPLPRVELGLALRGIASSCIDVSDGLAADLGHILNASKLGAIVNLDKIPCHEFLRDQLGKPEIQQCILAGGDDYELLFSAPVSQRATIQLLSQQLNLPLSLIGEITQNIGLQVTFKQQILDISKKGFDHFA
jgi:thiamine-monophosphate kinase